DALAPAPRFCRVLDTLKRIQDQNSGAASGLRIEPDKGCEATYYNNDKLIVKVEANQPLQYTYVDHYYIDPQSGYSVSHLLPEKRRKENFFPNDRSIAVGATKETVWEMDSTSAKELIAVITSRKPLFGSERPGPEAGPKYVTELREALDRTLSTAEMNAQYCFINTSD